MLSDSDFPTVHHTIHVYQSDSDPLVDAITAPKMVDSPSITNHQSSITNLQFFDLSGRRLSTPQRGLNIVRQSNGTTRIIKR
jgi:hypothetical protein